MPWSKYKGKSIGRVIQFIYRYAGVYIAERVIFHTYPRDGEPGEITLWGRPFANYVWEESDVPVFQFHEEYNWLNKVQEQKREEVTLMENLGPIAYANMKLERVKRDQ